jgi:hypothetical protein
MKLIRVPIFLFALAICSGVALLAEKEAPVAPKMVEAANQFLASLSPELKKKVSYAFDDELRFQWFFTPQQDKQKNFTRKGVRLEELSPEQRKLVLDLLRTGCSQKGYDQVVTIMSLEGILHDLEGPKGAMTRNPNWYFVTVFGEPSKTGSWGWRVEGHHLSVSFTIEKGELVSATPFFFGANPAEVKAGDKKGLRTLPEVEDHARALIDSLKEDQVKVAKQKEKQLPEIAEGTKRSPIKAPIGIPASQLTESQQGTLLKLLRAYADRMPEAIGAVELETVQKTDKAKIFFAYTGESQPGKPYTYRIHGPTFLVEFLNVQADGAGNPANHIHSSWRHLPADFGIKE